MNNYNFKTEEIVPASFFLLHKEEEEEEEPKPKPEVFPSYSDIEKSFLQHGHIYTAVEYKKEISFHTFSKHHYTNKYGGSYTKSFVHDLLIVPWHDYENFVSLIYLLQQTITSTTCLHNIDINYNGVTISFSCIDGVRIGNVDVYDSIHDFISLIIKALIFKQDFCVLEKKQ
jgi:hypothetical protein